MEYRIIKTHLLETDIPYIRNVSRKSTYNERTDLAIHSDLVTIPCIYLVYT